MCAEDFEQSKAAVERSLHSLDAYHQQFKHGTCASGERLEQLVNLNCLDERP